MTKDHERELYFFALELRAKRFYETTKFWPMTLEVANEALTAGVTPIRNEPCRERL